MTSRQETIGNFTDLSETPDNEYLHIVFHPSSLPIQQRWRNNGLSADFMADYATTFIPKDAEDSSNDRQLEIKAAISFITNELLENAMKYALQNCNQATHIRMLLNSDNIVISEENSASREQAARYRDFIEQLQNSDPMSLYLEQLEAKALEQNSSGLGFLTMLNDYNVELEWCFSEHNDGSSSTITTVVTMPI